MGDFRSEIEEKLPLTEDALLMSIGADLVGPQALPSLPSELAERAQRWLTAQQKQLQDKVCGDRIKRLVTEQGGDVLIAVELVNLLMNAVLPVNPVTLAVLLVNRGLKSFCATRWEASHGQERPAEGLDRRPG